MNLKSKTISSQLNWLNLNFKNKDDEKEFRESYFNKSVKRVQIAFLIVIVLYGLFGMLDKLAAPGLEVEFWIIRYAIVIPFLLLVYGLSFLVFFKRIWQELLALCFIVGGTGIIYMLVAIPNNMFYFGGFFLVLISGFFFLRIRFFSATLASLIQILIYTSLFIVVESNAIDSYNYLLLSLPFYFTTIIISAAASYHTEKLERLEYFQKIGLINKQAEIECINENLEKRIAESIKELKEAKEKAEESDRLKSAFLTNMSHEIRTPMNGILGFTNLLSEPEFNEENKNEFIRIIQKSGDRLLNTIDDIIEISKIEIGEYEIKKKEVNIREKISDIVSFFMSEAREKGLKLEMVFSGGNAFDTIETDESKFESIVTNLIKNAIKYSERGVISFGYEVDDENIKFYCKDNGIGIPSNRIEAIFNRFEQADLEDERAHEGSGLGLSICKSYIQMLEGKIWVESEVGRGSTFYFTLPHFKQNDTIPEKSKKLVSDPIPINTLDRKFNILVVEDSDTVVFYLKIILAKECKNLYFAKTGEEAIETMKKNQDIDIILMDIKMPLMDGYEATRRIREFNQRVIVIAQTAYAFESDKKKALDAGCNDYIAKPIKRELLFKMIDKHMSES